ncbi:MAG: DUF6503 family protein [Saprospiraceae bacterium]
MKQIFTFLTFLLLFTACKTNDFTANLPNNQAGKVIEKAINAHGGQRYETASYQFVFRDKTYTFKNNGVDYEYTLQYTKEGKQIFDKMNNDGFTRTINGNPARLTEKQISSYSNGLNSVIYFATLPHKLTDAAVNLKYAGTEIVKGKTYDRINVFFNEEGGGKDYDDQFIYWINQTTNTVDYLAYNYQVNGGGVRFREAYNSRRINGILFQDYGNYKAEVGTPLTDLAALFAKGELKKLSVIATEEVKAL